MAERTAGGAGVAPAEEPTRRPRVAWIDVARGVGIVLVSFGHLPNGDFHSVWLPALDPIMRAVYLFHMPLFFLLAGVTFSRRGGLAAFAGRKMRTLLVPYAVFSLYFAARALAVAAAPGLAAAVGATGAYELGPALFDVYVMGDGLWFLVALFVAEFGMYALERATGGRPVPLALAGGALAGAYFAVSGLAPGFALPFQLVRAVEALGFMAVGRALRGHLLALPRWRALAGAAVAAFLFGAAAACLLAPGAPAADTAPSWFISAAAALLGSLAVALACIAAGPCAALAYIGRASLVFYALQTVASNIAKLVAFHLLGICAATWPLAGQLAVGLVVTALMLAILYVGDRFVRRFMWWSIGAPRPVAAARR